MRWIKRTVYRRKMTKQIREFIRRGGRVSWFSVEGMEYYLRNSFRYDNGAIRSAVDIATVEVEPDYQKQGLFTMLREIVEREAAKYKVECVYVENVLHDGLLAHMRKLDYTEAGRPPSFLKRLA